MYGLGQASPLASTALALAGAAISISSLSKTKSVRAESSTLRRPLGKPMMFVRDPGMASIYNYCKNTVTLNVSNTEVFARKWKKFTTDRLSKLIVIADFDYTLTPAYKPTDDQALSTHSLLMGSEALGPQAEMVAREIFEKYFPIEQSPTLTKEEKLPFMIEWWTKTHQLMLEHGVSKSAIKKAVEASDITLREGFIEIFDLLARDNVPTLIFSAGLYDVIHAVLDKAYAVTSSKTLSKNVHVISNIMRYDEHDKIIGFEGTLIHSLNKSASAIIETDFWKQCQFEKRHNILLLGDSLGDSKMADGLDFKEDEIVRIGFLNDGADEKLDLYLQHFDVVLTNDSSLLPIELLLHQFQE